jgi:hypothetical protein
VPEKSDGSPERGDEKDGRKRPPEPIEKGVTRRHTFFCVDRKRHAEKTVMIEALPKTISVFGRKVEGWIITTEVLVIDKTITLAESLEGVGLQHDTE